MMLSMDLRVQLVNIANAGDEFFGSDQGLPFLNMTCWPYSCVQMLSRIAGIEGFQHPNGIYLVRNNSVHSFCNYLGGQY